MGEVGRQDIQRSNIVNPLTELQKDLPKRNRAAENYGCVHVLCLVRTDHRFANISDRLCGQIQMRMTLFKRLITGKRQPGGPGRLSKAGKSGRKLEEVAEMEGGTPAKQMNTTPKLARRRGRGKGRGRGKKSK